VGDHDDGDAPLLDQALEDLHDDGAVLRVEVAGGLVGQQDRGVVGDGAGDGDALLLAPGELAWAPIRQLAQPEGGQDVAGVALGVAAAPVAAAQDGEHHVLQHREFGEQEVELEDVAQQARAQLGPAIVVEGADVDALEQHLAGAGAVEGAEEVEERTLAGAGGAGQRHEFAPAHPQVDALEDAGLHLRPQLPDEPAGLDHRRIAHAICPRSTSTGSTREPRSAGIRLATMPVPSAKITPYT
jgi:hypothetical protein